MAGLKELRNRLESIKSTQKITSAMKLVAASRLRKAQLLLDRSAPYAQIIRTAVKRIAAEIYEEETIKKIKFLPPQMLRQKTDPKRYLLVVFASDRGLCGSYNQNVGKTAVRRLEELIKQGKQVQIICFGKKGYDILKRKHAAYIAEYLPALSADLDYQQATALAAKLQTFDGDAVEIVYSRFHSALTREMRVAQVYPLPAETMALTEEEKNLHRIGSAYYDYRPEKFALLDLLLPELMVNNIFSIMLNTLASEHGARMAAMDNATRNAKDMIGTLTLRYNSIRQAAITTELTEIISGAEAL